VITEQRSDRDGVGHGGTFSGRHRIWKTTDHNGKAIGSRVVEFSKELRDDVAAGDITVSFRLWRRPHAKVGGRYRVGLAEIEVDSMDVVPFASVTDADVRRAGEPDRETLRQRAAHAGPITDDTLLYRIAFHVVG
jgi:hypothetical protein